MSSDSTYIVEINVTKIREIDNKGNLLMRPDVEKESYHKIFDTEDELFKFLQFRPEKEIQVN